ncbi:unnamed protein product [Arctogadus glacialis]
MTAIRLCSVLCGCYEQEELTEYSHMGRLFIRLRGRSVHRRVPRVSGVAASIWCPGSQSKAGTVRSRKKGISMKSCDWIGCPARWHRPQVFKDDSASADWWTVRSRAARRSEPGPRGRSSSGRTAKHGRHLNH